MADFIEIEPDALPTVASLAAAQAASTAEVRTCPSCGEDVNCGERVAVGTAEGEQWYHPSDAPAPA